MLQLSVQLPKAAGAVLQRLCQCMQELNAAAIRKAEQAKPSFKDEPLETERVKRVKAPVTPILPPGAARLAADSAATSATAGGQHILKPKKGQASASEQAAAAESAGEKLQRAGHQWPSHVGGRSAPDTAQQGEGSHAHPGPGGKADANEQQLDVKDVDWKPGDAGVVPASSTGAGVGSDSRPAEQAAGGPSSSRYAQKVHSSPSHLKKPGDVQPPQCCDVVCVHLGLSAFVYPAASDSAAAVAGAPGEGTLRSPPRGSERWTRRTMMLCWLRLQPGILSWPIGGQPSSPAKLKRPGE